MDQENANPAPEGELLDDAPQLQDDAAAPEEIAQAPQLTDEDYEINFLGTNKYKLERDTPEHIRQSLKDLEKSLNKGWTEKNMRLAESQRAKEAEYEQQKSEVELQRASIKELSKLDALQEQINQYDNVDWARWAQTDPNAAWQAQIAAEGIRRQHAKLDTEIKEKQVQARQEQQNKAAQWMAWSAEKLQSSNRDWSAEKDKAVVRFATENYLNTNTPMDQGAVQAINWHPGLKQLAIDAMLYRDSLKKAVAPPQSTPAVPVPKVGGSAPVAKDPNKMTDAEWAVWRNQDIANKKRAENFRPRK